MRWTDKVQQSIAYIEAHLMEEIGAEDVARAINYAPASLSALFGAIAGYSVGEYIRFRRLSRAAEALLAGGSATDVALWCRYETPEAFTKAFKRMFGVPPSMIAKSDARHRTFAPISIDCRIEGGFGMRRNLIPGLMKVDWSDGRRQNEFVNSVVSALNALGEKLHYDRVCALSGSAFRASFSMPSAGEWNHGNYHVIHTPIIIEHTFRMLGHRMTHITRGDFARDARRVMDSIDRGAPVITLEGVVNCADACVISGYDNEGAVLLGYNPFMYVEDDHHEPHDDTGYFRKSGWHDGFFARGSLGRMLILEGPCEKPAPEAAFERTLALISRLIRAENLAPGQYNGLAAHRAFAHALMNYTWQDNFEPYLNLMCNYKQYLDRQYAAPYLRENGRPDLADCYARVTELCVQMGRLIPQDFSASEMFSDKRRLQPYADALLRIADIEEKAADLIG